MNRAFLAAALLALIAVPAQAAKNPRLHHFGSCASLSAYTRAHAGPTGPTRKEDAPAVPPTAAPAPTPSTSQGTAGAGSAAPVDASGTNVQEEGIDEPDIVKSDGTTLFTAVDGQLRAIDERADQPKILSSLPLEGNNAQLLEHDGRLLVISSNFTPVPETPMPGPVAVDTAGVATAVAPGSAATTLTEVDARDPSNMRVVRTMRADAAFVDARQKDSVARVVLSAVPQVTPEPGPMPLPQYRLAYGARKGGRAHHLVRCGAVLHPAAYDGSALLTVLTIDLDRGLPPIDSDAVMTSGQVVYGSPTGLYVATSAPNGATDVHKFDTSDPLRTDYRASGEIPGTLLDQFSLSELDGHLRAATTQSDNSESRVTILDEEGGRLVETGHVGGIGQGERIYAVRFIGTAGYVVTFRQTDPLFTLDLSNPAAPRVAGELQLQGYSSYLHPVGDGLLLGVGQDATAQGRQLGTQLSLFDVSDPANPKRLQQASLGSNSTSDAEDDHHAFLWWGPKNLAVVPVSQQSFTGALGFKVTRDGIAGAGRVTHEAGSSQVDILRSAVVGDRLFTVSRFGVEASALDGLAPQAWLAFPDAPGGSGSGGPVVPMGR
jgi:hypothetical protein